MEQQELRFRYGNFTGIVDWSSCHLEVESSFGNHYFQGDGSNAGVLENIIIYKSDDGQYVLQERSADQWTIYGAEGNELLVMRDCDGKATAVFARVPFWPTPHQLYAILYRSGVKPRTLHRIPCETNETHN
ncbi:unnamed protein product, partial [Iphiclides podalirius]